MGAMYALFNVTRRERVSFCRCGAGKPREIAGNPVAAAVATWYFITHRGDTMFFGPDDESYEWPSAEVSKADAWTWPDVEDRVLRDLENQQIVRDLGPCDSKDPYLRSRRFELTWISLEGRLPLTYPWRG